MKSPTKKDTSISLVEILAFFMKYFFSCSFNLEDLDEEDKNEEENKQNEKTENSSEEDEDVEDKLAFLISIKEKNLKSLYNSKNSAEAKLTI